MPSFFPPISDHYKFIRPNATGRTGVISLSLRLFDFFYGFESNWASKAAPPDMSVIYTLDGRPISGEIKWPYTASFDSSRLLHGYHALAVILVDAVNAAQYRVLPRQIKIESYNVVMSRVPTFGFSNRIANNFTVAADWVGIPAARPVQAPMVYPAVVAPPAHTMADPAKYRNAANWILEPLHQTSSELYDVTPSFYNDADGDAHVGLFQGFTQPEMEASMDRLWKLDFHDGARNNNSISPYSTFAYDWNSPDIYGVDVIGRFFKITPDGTVTTLFGPRGNPTVIPYKDDPGFYSQRIGVVTDGSLPDLSCSGDLAQHRSKPHIWYVPDMDRYRVVEIDLSEPTAMMKTYVTGIRIPAGIFAMPDNTLVIAEMGTHEARVDIPGIAVVAPDKSIRRLDMTGVNLPNPFCVRPTSDWKIICADQANNHTYEFDPAGGAVRQITNHSKLGPPTQIANKQWTWIAVDRLGAIGPLDDIVWVQYSNKQNVSNYRIGRHEDIAVAPKPFWTSSGGYCRVGAAQYVHDQMGHYPWAVAISERECRVLFYGGGGDGVLSYRGRVASDPPAEFDLTAFNTGKGVFRSGTIRGFPHGMRPTFTALLNLQGNGRLGIPCFDEIAAWPDDRLIRWIQTGMGGAVARPEIVGYPLACLMYFIRKNSTQGLLRRIPAPAKPADGVFPMISDVVTSTAGLVTWKTNEPTLGYVAFGSSAAYHRWSDPERVFETSHQVKLEYMPAACHISVHCTDQAGNVVFSPDVKLR